MPCCILSPATLDDMVLTDESSGSLWRRPSNESPKCRTVVSLSDVGESGFARYVKSIRTGVISNTDPELGLVPDEDMLQREIYERWRTLKPEDKTAWFSNVRRPWIHG
jgi:hypothetical protein